MGSSKDDKDEVDDTDTNADDDANDRGDATSGRLHGPLQACNRCQARQHDHGMF